MGAMYRLKAYFGMVPAEELGEYTDEPAPERYAPPRRTERSPREFAEERWDDRFSYEDPAARERYEDEWERRPGRQPSIDRPLAATRESARGPAGMSSPQIRGALAIDTESTLREPLRIADRPVPTAVPEQRDSPVRGAAALARITTLQPRSYKEARAIGECYRDGQPVIMNLTELDAADAKRLVDFAAGLVFALRGGFDKVTSRVFLLTPADVEVSADDARELAARTVTGTRIDAERGVFRQD
ncbi:cell division protein SepF [Pseudonocardia sp. GCM10023141]|uniref:cell division protein SepF n=1 Tax=Pseudonocardia sp. GCM10023141 TaxID=3252653 RepID=UPI00360DE017